MPSLKSKLVLFGILVLAVFSFSLPPVFAAPLTYSSAVSLYLTTPAVTFVIATSSVADSVVVNTGTVVITISNTTGGSLTLTSTSTDFSFTTSNNGSTLQSCSGSTASAVLSYAPTNGTPGTATFTVTPTASSCAPSTSGGSTTSGTPPPPTLSQGGGGGGGGSWTPIVPASTSTSVVATSSVVTTVSTSTDDALKSQIASLLAQLASLQAQVSGTPVSFLFTKNLSLGMIDPEVKQLQIYLNTHGFPVSVSGAGSPGFETEKFGALTRIALIKFQEAHADAILTPYGLTQGTGIFGAKTRGVVNR